MSGGPLAVFFWWVPDATVGNAAAPPRASGLHDADALSPAAGLAKTVT